MDNPFKLLREKHGMTKADLAESALIDVRAIARAEDGLYSNPLPNLVDYWVRKGTDRLVLESDYDDYVDFIRSQNHRKFGETLVPPQALVHPFRALRAQAGIGPVETARILCVPLDTIQFFEKKWRLQQSVPKPIKSALNQIGYTFEEIKEFEDTYKAWRLRHLGGVTFS